MMVLKVCSSSSKIQKCCGGRREKAIDVRDRISELPNDILSIILSSIPTRDSGRTSILSKRWRNVWISVPIIEIQDYWYYEEDHRKQVHFMNFVDRVLLPSSSSHNEFSCLRKLGLHCIFHYALSRVRDWISAVTTLDLEELDLEFSRNQYVELPPNNIFNCKKLVILKLTKIVLLNVPSLVCLPSLKKLHLIELTALNVDFVKSLLTGCPNLEELSITRGQRDKMKNKTLHIQSSSLKILILHSGLYKVCRSLSGIEIDASSLEQLNLFVDVHEQVDVNSLSSLVRVKLGLDTTYINRTRMDVYGIRTLDLLRKMSNTKYLHLSCGALESLEHRSVDHLPMFQNLTHLEVDIYPCSWRILPCLLESSPNLVSFILHKEKWDRYDSHLQSYLPKCSMLHLEKIELERITGRNYEIEMVSYFLKNAPELKRMSITFDCLKPREVSYLHDKIIMLPKASTACVIKIMGLIFTSKSCYTPLQSF